MVTTLGRKKTLVTVTFCAFGLGFGIGAITGFTPAEPDHPTMVGPAMAAPVAALPVSTPSATAQDESPAVAAAAPKVAAATPAAVPAAVDPLATPSLTEQTVLTPEALVDPASRANRGLRKEAMVVAHGDTLMDILGRASVDQSEAQAAIDALRKVYDPRRLQAGQNLVMALADPQASEPQTRQLLSLSLDLSFDHQLLVTRDADGDFVIRKVDRPQQRATVRRAGAIEDSLYLSAQRAEVPPDVLDQLIKLFSWDVDFQRDIHPGDSFETVFEVVSLAQDAAMMRGKLMFARLELSGQPLDAYRFTTRDGTAGYYDRRGRSLRKFLLRTPVDGAQLSSTFGMRKHPILGYSRMHKGVDFAAPTGTPIYAAGSGRIELAGRNGGYGNYVRIRHNDQFGTAYAHMSRIAKGIRRGVRVQQRQVIGYIGTTGRSTGPHLHYEVLRHGEQINPLKIKQGPATQLAGAELARLKAEIARIDKLRRKLGPARAIASALE